MANADSRNARDGRDAKRAEIALRYKRKRGPFSIYDAQIAALYKLRRHRLETDGDVSSADQITAIIANMRISRTPRNANTLGTAVELTDAERTALRIRVIAPCDVDKGVRSERTIKRKRQREKHRREFDRRFAGKPTRAKYEANSLSRTQPWKAEGISRRTWERRRKRGAGSATDTNAGSRDAGGATSTLVTRPRHLRQDRAPPLPQDHPSRANPSSAQPMVGRTKGLPRSMWPAEYAND
jgi:hypothetical protein